MKATRGGESEKLTRDVFLRSKDLEKRFSYGCEVDFVFSCFSLLFFSGIIIIFFNYFPLYLYN